MVRRRKVMSPRGSTRNILIRSDSRDYDEVDSFPQFLIGMPPWYVRVFLYGMMITCFAMVLFMESPEMRQHNDPQNQIKRADQSNDQPTRQQRTYDQSIIDQNCRMTNTEPRFSYCGSRKLEEFDNDENLQSILKDIQSVRHVRKFGIGYIDIGLQDGGYLALYAAKSISEMKVFVAEGNEVELQQLNIGIQANNLIGRINIIDSTKDQDIVTDRILKAIIAENLKEVMVKVDVQGQECAIFEKSDNFLSSLQITKIVLPWRADEERKHHGCVITMMSKLISHKFKPRLLRGDLLDWHAWKSWPNGFVVWQRQ